MQTVSRRGRLRKGESMDGQSILQFCKERNVEIYTQYDFLSDCFVIRMKRNQNFVERQISRSEAVNEAFGLTIRVILRSMADEIDRTEKGNHEAKEM